MAEQFRQNNIFLIYFAQIDVNSEMAKYVSVSFEVSSAIEHFGKGLESVLHY